MRYTVNQIIKDVNRKLHGGGASQTQDFYGALDEGRRSMLREIRPVEMERSVIIEEALYDQVDKYACPIDLKYEGVISIKALSSRRNVDTLNHPLERVYSRRFDQKRHGSKNIFAIVYQNGVKFLKLHQLKGIKEHEYLLMNDANSLTENGTWNTGGNLTNLRVDKLNYIAGKGSLKFDFNNSGTEGWLQNFTMDPVDISSYMETGAVFTWFNLVNWKIITSVKLTFGSNLTDLTTDLYEFTVNQPYDNSQFTNGWNLLRFPLYNTTQVGTPNPKDIKYVKITFTTTGESMVDCNIDNIITRKGKVYELNYESAFCFLDQNTLAWKQFATSNTDYIVLEEDGYQILMLETAKAILQESYGNSDRGNNDIANLIAELNVAYRLYKNQHKSEVIEPEQTSYIFGTPYDGYTDQSLTDNFNRLGREENDQ